MKVERPFVYGPDDLGVLAHALALVHPIASARVVIYIYILLLLLLPLLLLPLHLQTADMFWRQKKDRGAAHKGRLNLVITSAEGEHIPSGEQHQILNRRSQQLTTRNCDMRCSPRPILKHGG